MKQSEEIWKDIPGYEGLYMVSNLGNVYSLGRTTMSKRGTLIIKKPKMLKHHKNVYGYVNVALIDINGKRRTCGIHRLVALAFVHNPDPKNFTQINHKNEIKNDNRPENLEWCTASYNINYGTRNERVASKMEIPIVGIDIVDGHQINFKSLSQARRMGYTASGCLSGNVKTTKGLYLKYANDDNWKQPIIIDKSKSITAISVKTGKELVFKSLHDAERSGFSRVRIKTVLNGQTDSYKGYYWKVTNDSSWTKPTRIRRPNEIPIYGISIVDGHRVDYQCMREACEINGWKSESNIANCIAGRQSTYKKYKWYKA